MKRGFRGVTMVVAVLASVGLSAIIPSLAARTNLGDANDSPGRLDLQHVRFDQDAGPASWAVRTFDSWTVGDIQDAGFVLVILEHAGEPRRGLPRRRPVRRTEADRAAPAATGQRPGRRGGPGPGREVRSRWPHGDGWHGQAQVRAEANVALLVGALAVHREGLSADLSGPCAGRTRRTAGDPEPVAHAHAVTQSHRQPHAVVEPVARRRAPRRL